MPDIDIDFSVRGRERVIRYVQEKYGRESVAQIITFGKMAPRAATRDAARVLGYDYAHRRPHREADPGADHGPQPELRRLPEAGAGPAQGGRRRRATSSGSSRSRRGSRGSSATTRSTPPRSSSPTARSTRSCRCSSPRTAAPPTTNGDGGKPERQYKIVTQYSMGPIEEIGLLKMDFLGLRNLDVIEDAVDIIRRSRGVEIEMESIPLDDAKTYEMLARGDSVGVFQLESEGMREALKQIRPTEFNDIVAIGALYRPGAMRFIPDYARGKRNPASVTYQDPRLRPITEETYGCCIYQEQLMEISKQIGGFTPGPGGRPAQGGRQEEARPDGHDGGQVHRGLRGLGHRAGGGQGPVVADDRGRRLLVQQVPRGLLRADLLPHRLPEGQLPGRVHGGGDLLGDVDEGQGPVLRQQMRRRWTSRCCRPTSTPPTTASSSPATRSASDSTRSRTSATAAVETIIASREAEGPFESIWDFCERVDSRAVNKRAIECLIKCGALDSTGDSRRGMLEVLAQAQSAGQKAQEDSRRGQGSIFDLGGGAGDAQSPAYSAFAAPRHRAVPAEEFEQREMLALEKETLGTFVSAHPLGEVRDALRARVERPLSAVSGMADGAWVTVGGIVAEAKKVRTRRGGYVMFAALDDLEGRLDLFVRDAASEPAEALEVDRVVVVRGRIEKGEEGKLSLNVHEAEHFEPGADELAKARAAAAAGRRAARAQHRRRRRSPPASSTS